MLSLGILVLGNVSAMWGFAVRLRTQFDEHRAHIDARLDTLVATYDERVERLRADRERCEDEERQCRIANEEAHRLIRADGLTREVQGEYGLQHLYTVGAPCRAHVVSLS